MKIAKATITALLYTSKTLANGEHPVMIRVCYNGKRKYKSTGLSCPAKLWNTAKQEVRGRHPLSMNMNALIESELMCLKNKVLDYERQGMAYSVQRLDVRTAKRALETGELEAIVRYYLDTYYYKTNRKPDVKTMQRRYWRSRVYGADGTVRQAAIDAEQFSLALFICSYIFQGLALVDLARLKWKDMVCIEIPDKEKYDRDRTTYGLRYAEVHKATATFYEINLVRAKTQHPTRVLVERSVAWPYMVPFLGPGKARGNDFVFPIYFDEDPVHQFERITYANNVINQSLQRVAKRIGLTRKVTFYAARHTYASRLYHADVPLPLIAQNMGRNPAEIETYLKEFDTDKIISANKRIWQIPRTEPLETNTGGL